MSNLSKEFLHERDQRIYKMRATGISPTDIASQLDITPATVHNAISRHLRMLNSGEFSLVEVVVMELDRLDKMQSAIFPLTQHRRVTMDDGSQITVEPDLRAIDSMLKVMQHRAKLLGLDVQRTMDIAAPTTIDVSSSLKGKEQKDSEDSAISLEDETRKLLQLSAQAGIFDEETVNRMLSDNVIEAEVVEDSDA